MVRACETPRGERENPGGGRGAGVLAWKSKCNFLNNLCIFLLHYLVGVGRKSNVDSQVAEPSRSVDGRLRLEKQAKTRMTKLQLSDGSAIVKRGSQVHP